MKLRKLSNKFDIYISDESNRAINRNVIIKDNKVYYRFMDQLYIPEHVYNLPIDFVIELNNIRDEYSNEIIDITFNELVYKQIINSVSNRINDPARILDFGCGVGGAFPWLNYAFPKTTIYGYDIRKTKSVNDYYRKDIGKIDLQLPYPDNYYSVIFAFFVFHFFISEFQINELRRTLSDDGLLAFNLINSSDFTILDRLHHGGFSVIEDMDFNSIKNTGRGFIFFLSKSE